MLQGLGAGAIFFGAFPLAVFVTIWALAPVRALRPMLSFVVLAYLGGIVALIGGSALGGLLTPFSLVCTPLLSVALNSLWSRMLLGTPRNRSIQIGVLTTVELSITGFMTLVTLLSGTSHC